MGFSVFMIRAGGRYLSAPWCLRRYVCCFRDPFEPNSDLSLTNWIGLNIDKEATNPLGLAIFYPLNPSFNSKQWAEQTLETVNEWYKKALTLQDHVSKGHKYMTLTPPSTNEFIRWLRQLQEFINTVHQLDAEVFVKHDAHSFTSDEGLIRGGL